MEITPEPTVFLVGNEALVYPNLLVKHFRVDKRIRQLRNSTVSRNSSNALQIDMDFVETLDTRTNLVIRPTNFLIFVRSSKLDFKPLGAIFRIKLILPLLTKLSNYVICLLCCFDFEVNWFI